MENKTVNVNNPTQINIGQQENSVQTIGKIAEKEISHAPLSNAGLSPCPVILDLRKGVVSMNRRDFIKKSAYVSASVLFAEQLIEPLMSFAGARPGNITDSGLDYLLDSLHSMILEVPYHDSRCLDLIKLSGLYEKCGRRQDGLVALSESVEAARPVKEDNRLEYASLLTEVADAYYNIGEQGVSHNVALEAFEVLRHEFDNKYSRRLIVPTARMLDKVGEREKALQWLKEGTPRWAGNSDLLMQSAKAYLALGVDYRAKELAIEYMCCDDINQMVAARRLAELAEGLADMGRIGKAHDLIFSAVTRRNGLEKPRQFGVARDISIVYAKLGEWDKALKIADEADCENSYFKIASHAVTVGKMHIARKAAYPALASLEPEAERYIFMLSSPEVAALFREMGDTQQAVRTISRSLAYLEGSSMREYWRGQELTGSAAVFIKMDDKAEALKLLHKAFESAIREDDTMLKINSLLRIAEVYVENQIPVAEEERAFVRMVMA